MPKVTDVLNDIEIAEVLKFIENRTMAEAVKKVILYGVYFNGTLKPGEPANPMRNFALLIGSTTEGVPPEEQFAHVMAYSKAINLLESGFAQFAKLKAPEAPIPSEENGAR